METIKISSLNESRQKTIRFIIEKKHEIKSLETQIEGMVTDTKQFLIDKKIEKIVNEEDLKLCTLSEGTSTPSFKQVFEVAQTKLDDKTKDLLLTVFEKLGKPSYRIVFG
jgi:hypothetical protein